MTTRGTTRSASDHLAPQANLADVRKSLDSSIGAGPSGKKADRTVAIATGLDGKLIQVRLVVTQQSGHPDRAGSRERRGHPTDTVTTVCVFDLESKTAIVSGSFGNGNGRREHVVETIARTLRSWINQQLALEPVGSEA